MEQTLVFTRHATQRMALRGISELDVNYIYNNGARIFRAGALFIYLKRRNVSETDLKQNKYNRLIGSTILLNSIDQKTVVTVYRNGKANKKDRSKKKYNRLVEKNYLPLAG